SEPGRQTPWLPRVPGLPMRVVTIHLGGHFMTVSRLIVGVPVVAGLLVTGSAVARMAPATTVRDSVYQTCAHNGVHFNKQGHPNCGLHKGWQSAPTSTAPE